MKLIMDRTNQGKLSKEDIKLPSESESTDFNPYSDWIIGGLNMDGRNNGSRKSEQSTSKQRVGKVGFVNMGYTCYVNATLQALLHTESFTDWLQQDREHQERCIDKQNCIFCAMKGLFDKITKEAISVIAPLEIVSRLKSIGSSFKVGVQDDAHDFLIQLLDSIEISLREAYGLQATDSATTEIKSVYSQLFGGVVESNVCCENCGRESKHEDFLSELELDMKDVSSIEGAVRSYFKEETLADYKCETCKSVGDSSKQFLLSTPPKILCLYLKRFTQDGSKIDNKIICNKYLDLSEYLSPKSNKVTLKYRLSSRILHKGSSPNSGHYTTIAQDAEGKLTLYNDEIVQQIDDNFAPCSDTYVLFYEMDESSAGVTKNSDNITVHLVPQPTTLKMSSNGSCETNLATVVSSCNLPKKSNALSLTKRKLKSSQASYCESSVIQIKQVTQSDYKFEEDNVHPHAKDTKNQKLDSSISIEKSSQTTVKIVKRKLEQPKLVGNQKGRSKQSSNIKVPKLDCVKEITGVLPTKVDGKKNTDSHNESEKSDQTNEQHDPSIKKQTKESADTPAEETNRLTCDICHKYFKATGTLNRHKYRDHGIKGLYKCQVCEKAFDTSVRVYQHFTRVHGSKRFECVQCGKKFQALYKLKRHLSSHEREVAKRKFLNPTVEEQASNIHDNNELLTALKDVDEKVKSLFSCDICGNEFLYQKNLDRHKQTIHSVKKLYKCFFCTNTFDSISDRNKHRNNVHGKKPFSCSKCDSKFRNIQLLNQHLLKTHGIQSTYNCMECPSKFDTKQDLNYHVAVEHKNQEIVSCRHCSTNVLKGSIIKHIRRVHPDVKLTFRKTLRLPPSRYRTNRERNEQFILKHGHRRHRCNQCVKSFNRKRDILRHKSIHHMAKNIYSCDICNKSFRLYIEYRAHRERSHNLGEYKCNICEHVFGSKQILYKHKVEAHANKKIEKCPHCNVLKQLGFNMRQHIDIAHNPNNPYHCMLCNNMHKTSKALENHLKVAHGKEGFICDECPLEFERLIHLLKHKLQNHPNLNRHICENCGIGYNTKDQLRFHVLQGYCNMCTYKFDTPEEKLRFLRMRRNKSMILKMVKRNSNLIRNVKNKSLKEQKDDFIEVYELSKHLVPMIEAFRKLYVLVFVPNHITEDQLKEYLNDLSTEKYFYVGKLSPSYSYKTISLHHCQLMGCAATKLRVNSGFKCYHINDMWIGEHFKDHSLATLNYMEALNILKLLMFAIYYERDDIFIQNPELDPLFKLEKHIVQELLDDVIMSEGNILRLSGFGFQFVKEIEMKENSKIETNEGKSFSCERCNAVHNLYVPVLSVRHAAKCLRKKHSEEPKGKVEKLLSLKRVSVNSIFKTLKEGCQERRYICYSITGINKLLRTRDAVLNYNRKAMKYHGQSSNGYVSSYHFDEKFKSSVRNMAMDGYQLYLTHIWANDNEKSMYQTEIMLQIREIVRTSKGNKSLAAFKYLKLYNVSLLFTFEEWMEVFTWSRDESGDPDSLPKFVQASQTSTFKNITKSIFNGSSHTKLSENECGYEEE